MAIYIYMTGYVVAGHLKLTTEETHKNISNSTGDKNDILYIVIIVGLVVSTLYLCSMIV